MEQEFSAPLHSTQYGNHLECKQKKPAHMNPEVKKLVDSGYNIRTAYRIIERRNNAAKAAKKRFDYETETPKGERV